MTTEAGSVDFDPSYLIRNTSFDPHFQPLQLLYPDGVHLFEARMDDVAFFQALALKTAFNFAVQIGLSFALMLIIALLTKPERRLTIVFFLNMSALVTIFIRSILMCTTLVGPYYNFYNWIMGDYPDVAAANRVSVAAEAFGFLVIFFLELSMMFQVRIVCVNLSAIKRRIVTYSSIFVALEVCTIRFALMVINADWSVIHGNEITDQQKQTINQLGSAYNISTIVSIIFFNVIFVTKLGIAIKHRHTMGMKQFGPMQIIFVMGCQTLFIPAIFGIITYFALANTQVYSLMPMVVAIFLPLSSMWASFNTNNKISVANMRQAEVYRPNMIVGQDTTRNTNNSGNGTTSAVSNGTAGTYVSDTRPLNASFNTQGTLVNSPSTEAMNNPHNFGAKGFAGVNTAERDSLELEMRQHGIAQGRSYSVRSD